MKTTSRTEQKNYSFNNAPRCAARTKHNNGKPCRCPAVRNMKRCRVHGGARGSGGQLGNSNALKHGYSTKEIKQFKKSIKEILKMTKEFS